MPKFFITMNYVEAKKTSFVIEAKDEDDIREAMGEIDIDFFENHDNVKWVCSDYEPPIIDSIVNIKHSQKDTTFCTVKQQKNIQKEFDKIIDSFNKVEHTNE